MNFSQDTTPINDIYTGIITSSALLYNSTYTFFCLLDGDAVITFKDQRLSQLSREDVVFIPPDTQWEISTSDSVIFFVVSFNYLFAENALAYRAFERLTCNAALTRQSPDTWLIQQLASIATAALSDAGAMLLAALSLNLFQYIGSRYLTDIYPCRPDGLSEKQFRNILKITDYIQTHYTSPITLAALGEVFDMTPQYLSGFFKQATGGTVFEYLEKVRLQRAFDHVARSQETPFYIAAVTGFPNLNAFTKAFTSRYGQTPEQWRKTHPVKPPALLSGSLSRIASPGLSRDYINNYIPLRPSTAPELLKSRDTARICIPAGAGEPYAQPWSQIVNLGFVQSFMHGDYRHQLSQIQEIMHFRFGRLLRPFDIVHPVTVDGCRLYDFSKLFRVLDYMHPIRPLPLIELGNKPPKINVNVMDHVDFNTPQAVADYYEQLLDILPKFLHQCMNRYGADEVSGWQFELWTEHIYIDTSVESPEVYAQYFAKIYRTIKDILPGCGVGGPGYNTGAPLPRFGRVMDCVLATGCIPDFITAYIYPYVPENNEFFVNTKHRPILSPDKTIYYRRLKRLRDYCQEHYPEISRLWITEYACDVSSRNFINDSIYQATFIAKFNLDGLGLADAFAYWLISDISLEYKDSNRILFGGNGLINRNGIYKPGFHAAHFLKDMGERILYKGENCLLTSAHGTHYQLIVFNYAHLHADFCRDNTSYASLKNPTAVFEATDPKDMTFVLSGLAPGNYRIHHYAINNDHANLLNEWIRLGAPENLSRSDIRYLQSRSWPHQELYFKEISGELELSCHLMPQEVDLYLIDKII